MLCVFVSLHVIVAQVADQAQLVVFYILYHHILVMKLLDDDFTIISIRVHAADSVVRDPYRIIAVFGIDHKITRTRLLQIRRQCQSLSV